MVERSTARWRRISLGLGTAVIAASLAACSGDTGEPDPDPTSGSAQARASQTPGPGLTPTSSVSPTDANCLSSEQVMAALTKEQPGLPSGTRITSEPICAEGWAYASLEATGIGGAGVFLQQSGTTWRVVTFGSAPCTAEEVAAAPAAVRAAAKC